MNLFFEELDYRETPIGVLSLRRRRELSRDIDVYEIKLDDEYLMSSLFTDAEVALAEIGLAACGEGKALNVVVGGLGLGYTAVAALESTAVGSLIVVDALGEVIDWHQRCLLPLGGRLVGDPRARLVQGDFFRLAQSRDAGFDPGDPTRRFDAILVDIDHAPDNLLDPSHADFYTADGLRALTRHLVPGGVFALWSNDPPDEAFLAVLRGVFASVEARVVRFHNPFQDVEASNSVYIAHTAPA